MADNAEVPNPSDSSLDLEPVFSAMGIEAEMEAIGIQTMLDASGIQAVIVGSSSLPTLPFEVRVPAGEVEQALRLIEEARAAGPAAAEEAEQQALVVTPGLIGTTIPALPSLNLDESIACYAQLGFKLAMRYGDEYAIVERDGRHIHLWPCDDKYVSENSGCYIYSPDVRALHDELAANGVDRITDVELKPWKMLEFNVTDSSGNVLRFGQDAA